MALTQQARARAGSVRYEANHDGDGRSYAQGDRDGIMSQLLRQLGPGHPIFGPGGVLSGHPVYGHPILGPTGPFGPGQGINQGGPVFIGGQPQQPLPGGGAGPIIAQPGTGTLVPVMPGGPILPQPINGPVFRRGA